MDTTICKLILKSSTGQDQEFELGARNISIGRAMTNDIILADPRASRQHAKVECGTAGYTLVDLGSGNGTYLDGAQVQRAALKDGDVITIGGSTLEFLSAPSTPEAGMTLIDSESDLHKTLTQMTMSMNVSETDLPRLVVHTPGNTWELPMTVDILSIGRSNDNDVVIGYDKTSRHHARIERRRDIFTIKDLNSTNGVWVGGKRVEQAQLQNGDSIRIGPAQLVFKGAFKPDDLTITGESPFHKQSAPRRPVVFVPGVMGSELWRGSERVWPNVKILFTNPEIFRLTDDSPLEAHGLVKEIVIVPNLIKSEQYNRLGDYLVEDLGYERGKDFLEFAYDWRRDVRQSAQRLADTIDHWDVEPPIIFIAHSLGCLVARYYVERLGGKNKAGRLILLGGPHQGTPKGATSLFRGPAVLPFGMMGERLRDLVSGFPSAYQILPTYPCATDQNGQKINLMADETWVTPQQRFFLREARQFRQELGNSSSVPAISIFGYGLKTVLEMQVTRGLDGHWEKLLLNADTRGDDSIPEESAILPNSEIHPVQQHHGAIYVDNDVKMRLKLELTRKM